MTIERGTVNLDGWFCTVYDKTYHDRLGNSAAVALFGDNGQGELVVEFLERVPANTQEEVQDYVRQTIVGPLVWGHDAESRDQFWRAVNGRYNHRPGNHSRHHKSLFYHEYRNLPEQRQETYRAELQGELDDNRGHRQRVGLDELGELTARLATTLATGRLNGLAVVVGGHTYTIGITANEPSVSCDGRWFAQHIAWDHKPATAADRQAFVAAFEDIERALGPITATPVDALAKAQRLVADRGLG